MEQSTTKLWQLSFWNPRKAANRLEQGVMSRDEKFSYLWLGVLALAVATEGMYYLEPVGPDHLELAGTFFYIGTSLLGLLYLYHKHTTDDSFIERLVVVTVSSFFWVLGVVVIPFGVLTLLAYLFLFPEVSETTELIRFDVLITLPFAALMYGYLGRFFGGAPNSDVTN